MTTRVENPVNQIADLLNGNSDSEVKEDKGESQETEVTSEEAVDNTVDNDAVEVDESHPQAESLNEDDVTETEASAEEEAADIDTLNNLAEELDIPIADMYALNVKLAEGNDPVTLGVLKDFYESNSDIETVRQDIVTKEAELQEEVQRVQAMPKITNELLEARARKMSIEDQYNRVNWEELRVNKPGEYAALQADFRSHYEAAVGSVDSASQAVDASKTQYDAIQQQKLFDAMPELKDDKVRADTATAVQAFVGKYGLTANELDAIDDSRVMRLLIDASRSATAKTTAKAKQVVKTPTATKPSGVGTDPTSRKAALKRLTQKAKATGQTADQVNAISAMLK